MGQRVICPATMKPHVLKVLQGEYDIPELSLDKPVILDLGANVGAFTVWAQQRWPGALVHAYEPNPEAVKLFKENCPDVDISEVAVYDQEGEATLYTGANNLGEASLFRMGEQATAGPTVRLISAAELPPCDLMKIDTEGSELSILCSYKHLSGVKAITLEWHSSPDRYKIGSLLGDEGFILYSDVAWAKERGNMKFWRHK